MKTTPLTNWHQDHAGNMVDFGGFWMPLHYAKGILHEHHTVREKVGLFDVSHMGEFILKGPDALSNLQYLVSNDFTDLQIGKARYGILVREDGSSVDDLLIYKTHEDRYLIVVNAANIEKDETYFRAKLTGNVKFENISETIGQIAVQGPMADTLFKRFSDLELSYYGFQDAVMINDMQVLVSRTGYTGEDGYEIYCKAEDTVKLWDLLMTSGEDLGVETCGLGCRDTLRLEAAMPLFGHELSDETTPLEAGLSMFVKLDKEHFIAKEALSNKPLRRRIGLTLTDRGIAREGSDVYCEGEWVGKVTSGTKSPTLNQAIAMAMVKAEYFKVEDFEIDVRGKRLKAVRVKLPFYKRQGAK